MESTNVERGAGRNKRKWTDFEDEKLVEALMELVNTGNFKADNGFKPGYLTFLETSLQTKLPEAGLKGKPHIESRIKTLKRILVLCMISDIEQTVRDLDGTQKTMLLRHQGMRGFSTLKNHNSVTGRMFTEGTAVEVSFQEEKHDVWHVGTVMKVTGINKCLVKFQCPGDGNEDRVQEFASPDVRPSPPSVEDNVFVLREEVEAYFECCWWSGVIKKPPVDGRYRVLIKHSKKELEFDHVNLRPRMVWTDGKWSSEAKTIKESTEGSNSAKRKRGRPKKFLKKKIGNEAKSIAEKDFLMSTTLNEIPNNGDSSRLRSGVRRNNGVLSKTANTPLPEGQSGEAVLSESVNRPHNSVSNGHGELSKHVDSESRYQDCHEIDHVKYDDILIDEVGGTADDQPLSMWLKILPPIGSDDSRALPVGEQVGSGTPPLNQEDTIDSSPLQKTDGPNDLPVKNLNQSAESNDKGGELGPPATARTDAMESEEESLPFVKRFPLWKYIESLETYKKMTKKPHFSPLYERIEEDREGLAIGHMVNYFNLVEDTSKLQFSSDIAVIERGLKALAEFKSHGFDVEKVQACLTHLLLKKQRAKELEKEYGDIRNKISNSVDEGGLDEEISQLEKKLAEAKLKKENREKALSALQSKGHAIADNIKSVQVEFESIVGSLYGN